MKRITAILLSALILLTVCAAFCGCGKDKNRKEKENIVIQNIEVKDQDDAQYNGHHRIEVKYEVNADIGDVTIRYIFSKGGESYYIERDQSDLTKNSTRSTDIPLPIGDNYKNADPAKPDLTDSAKDVLDVLGKGTEITIEFRFDDKVMASDSVTY